MPCLRLHGAPCCPEIILSPLTGVPLNYYMFFMISQRQSYKGSRGMGNGSCSFPLTRTLPQCRLECVEFVFNPRQINSLNRAGSLFSTCLIAIGIVCMSVREEFPC